MFGAEEFIKQRLPDGAVFSEIFWVKNVVTTGIVERDYLPFGAQWILISGLQINADNVGGLFTFKDAYGDTLFEMFEFRESSGMFDFFYLVKGSTLKIICSSLTVKFSVGHQYITKKVVK